MSTIAPAVNRLRVMVAATTSFFQWWLAELAGLLPGRIRTGLHLGHELIELLPTDGGIQLAHVGPEGRRVLYTFSDQEDEATLWMETLRRTRDQGHRLVLRLPAQVTVVRDISLPAAAGENLAQVLRYEMDRYTPFKAEAVYFGHRILEHHATQGRLRVRLVVVPRNVLDHWLDQFRAWGTDPDWVEAEQVQGVHLTFAARERPARQHVFTLRNALLSLTVILVIAIALLPLWRMREVVLFLNQEVAQVKQTASQALDLRAERDQLLSRSDYLVDMKRNRHPVISVINELSRILPDTTWLMSLQYNDMRLSIRGYSTSASDLIGLIEASPMFDSVSFVAPVTRDRTSGQDMFQIALDVKERQL